MRFSNPEPRRVNAPLLPNLSKPLLHVRAWGALPFTPEILGPQLAWRYAQLLEEGYLKLAPSHYGPTLVLSPKGFVDLGLRKTTATPNEHSRSRRVLAFLASRGARRLGWVPLSLCAQGVLVLGREHELDRTALLYVAYPRPSKALFDRMANPYACGGSKRSHETFFFFSPRPHALRSARHSHVKRLEPPEALYWVGRLENRAKELYGFTAS